MKFTKILLAALFCVGCQVAGFAQTSVSLVKTMPAGQTLFSDTVGYKFTVGSKPLKVSALGVAKGNGLNSANQVGLWNEAGQLLASATIPLNATLENGFFWQNLSAEVTLAATTTYTVGQDRLQLDGAASGYYLGESGVNGVSGTGLWAELGATDELIAIIRSANTTAVNSTNTVSMALFV